MTLMLAQLEAGNNLAIATQEDLASTLDMVGSTMKTFGLEAEDTRGVVDSLAAVTTLANTTLKDIGQALVNCGGSAANAGLSIDEVNAVLVAFSNNGLKSGSCREPSRPSTRTGTASKSKLGHWEQRSNRGYNGSFRGLTR